MSTRRASRAGDWRRWVPLLLGLGPVAASAELPVGWSVHIFTGRIHEIEPAGGVLACATDGGLLFFDPRTQEFAPPIADAGCTDGDCLSSNRLTSVSRDAEGSYWLGTEASGVVVFHPGSSGRQFGRFFEVNAAPGGGLLADSVRCIEAYQARTVYVGTSRGVAQIELVAGSASYNPDASRRLGSDLQGSIIHDIAVDSSFVWVATDSGVSRYQRTHPYTVELVRDSLAGREALTVEILAGTVYAGTTVGAFRWQDTGRYWERIRNCPTCPPQPPPFRAYSITRLADGRLGVGSDVDVLFYNGSVWGPLSPPPISLLGERVFTSIIATGDTMWTGQHNGAGEGGYLETWSPAQPNWRRFEANEIPPSSIRRLSIGPQRDLWIGTELAGVARLAADGTWCIWNGNDPNVRGNMSNDEGFISALLAARDGGVWFTALPQPGLSAPIDILTPTTACDHTADAWAHIAPGQLGFGGRYWRMEQDADGNVFCLADGDPDGVTGTTGNGGMDIVAPNGIQKTNLRDTVLGAKSVGALAFETTASSWEFAYVGLNGQVDQGLKRWKRSNQLYPPNEPSSNNFFTLQLPDTLDVTYRDIVVTPGNSRRIWVGTNADVFEYDVLEDSIKTVVQVRRGATAGLLSGDIKDLQFDDFGNLWVATVKGLNRLRLAERVPGRPVSVDAFTTIETIRELNAASSVGQIYDPAKTLAPLPSPLVNSLAYDHDRDLLYIGTSAGLATLDVQGFSRRPVIPLEQAVLYPNPVRIDAGHEEVRIANISEPATVTIYTLEGQIVCEVTEREDGDVVWTLSTPSCLQGEGNFQIASGIYPVRITTSSGSTMRTVVVVR